MTAPLILIVEDEPKLAEILHDYLERAGYATHHIGNGQLVAPWVREHQPVLILLEWGP